MPPEALMTEKTNVVMIAVLTFIHSTFNLHGPVQWKSMIYKVLPSERKNYKMRGGAQAQACELESDYGEGPTRSVHAFVLRGKFG